MAVTWMRFLPPPGLPASFLLVLLNSCVISQHLGIHQTEFQDKSSTVNLSSVFLILLFGRAVSLLTTRLQKKPVPQTAQNLSNGKNLIHGERYFIPNCHRSLFLINQFFFFLTVKLFFQSIMLSSEKFQEILRKQNLEALDNFQLFRSN